MLFLFCCFVILFTWDEWIKAECFYLVFLLVCNSLQYVLMWWKTNLRPSETHARGGERATDSLKQPNGGVSNDPHSVINLVDISIFNIDGCVCTTLFSQASCPGGAWRSPAIVKVLWGFAEITCRASGSLMWTWAVSL